MKIELLHSNRRDIWPHKADVSAIMFPLLPLILLFFSLPISLQSQSDYPLKVDAGITFSHFQQQVKEEIGGARGERLVDETSLGLALSGSYALLQWLDGGIFLRGDVGNRIAARFNGFDSAGGTVTTGEVGGSFSELWVGSFLRTSWKSLSAELGYALIGTRSDAGRSDLPSTSGDTTSSFTTSPTVAWMITLGGAVPITEQLHFFVEAEYRVRYYVQRGGEDILTGVEHGTQSLAPIIGIRYVW